MRLLSEILNEQFDDDCYQTKTSIEQVLAKNCVASFIIFLDRNGGEYKKDIRNF